MRPDRDSVQDSIIRFLTASRWSFNVRHRTIPPGVSSPDHSVWIEHISNDPSIFPYKNIHLDEFFHRALMTRTRWGSRMARFTLYAELTTVYILWSNLTKKTSSFEIFKSQVHVCAYLWPTFAEGFPTIPTPWWNRPNQPRYPSPPPPTSPRQHIIQVVYGRLLVHAIQATTLRLSRGLRCLQATRGMA